MPTSLRRGLRHTRRGLFYAVTSVLILLALAVAVANQLLPMVQRHPDRIAAWLMARAGRPVSFDSAEAHWTPRGPLFTLHNLRIGSGRQLLEVDNAQLLVAMYSGWLPGHPLTELRLRGLALTLQRAADGSWRFLGLTGPKERPDADPLSSLEGLGELQVSDARLTVRAPDLGINFVARRVDVRLRVGKGSLQAGLRAYAEHGPPLQAALEIKRPEVDGRLWVGGNKLQLASWSPLLGYAGIRATQGEGTVGIWADLRARRVVSVQAEADLQAVTLRGNTPIAGEPGDTLPIANAAPGFGVLDRMLHAATAGTANPALVSHVPLESRADIRRLRIGASWRVVPGGWQLVAPLLRVQLAGDEQDLDGLAVQNAPRIVLAAQHVDAGALATLAALSDRLPNGLRRWLLLAAPNVRLANLRIDGVRDGPLHGSASIEQASWSPVGQTPALQGLAGTLLFDRNALALRIAPRKLTVLWPPAFAAPVPMRIDGRVVLWRDGAAWTLDSSALRLRNDDLDLSTRFAMRFDGDGTRPRLDLFSTLGPVDLHNAHRYWIRNRMSPHLIAWLDGAIERGSLLGAHVIVSGDLDDWPFRHDEGLFEAVADLDDAQLKFRPDWPAAEHMSGQLAFVGEGMRFDGGGAINGLPVAQVHAEIPHFPLPVLEVDANAAANGSQLLSLLRASPLEKRYASSFDALAVDGAAKVTMRLLQPLKHELGETSLQGTVDLANAKLSDSRWKLLFTDASGQIRYGEKGLRIDGMQVRVNGDPGVFGIAIGADTGNAATAVDATLTGMFPVATLVQHAPSLSWLIPIIGGRAAWTVNIQVPNVPANAPSAPSRLSVRSDLRGATLTLPAPLAKAAATPLALTVQAPLPASAGEIGVQLGDLLHLRGRYDDVQPFRALLTFGGEAVGALPAQGIVVGGHVPVLDVGDWIGYASRGEGGAGGITAIDLHADGMDILGSRFGPARLRMQKLPVATQFRVEGAQIDGTVLVPTQLALGIHGQFARLYWPKPPAVTAPATTADAVAESTDTTADATDPAKLPPLHLDIDDLRYGDAQLGRTLLDTVPMPQGLRIHQLLAQSPAQTINASGVWTGRGSAARTRLTLDFRADSLGRMLDALGFQGMVDGGKTHATLDASWAGVPAAFALARLDGKLDLDVGKGRLLEVKPGAGRILGLVSLAAIPRRLSLDFRDFFEKGFGFDTLTGHFVFANGQAHTDDLQIRGPAADIRVRGSANLVAQTYDQTIEVRPKAGGMITAVGAIAGGPVGAAIGAVAQAVLKKPLSQMTRKFYRVTGPWKNPDVQVNQGEAETPQEQPPQGSS
jgi:uncharacterized protein (TIGR02099 family)